MRKTILSMLCVVYLSFQANAQRQGSDKSLFLQAGITNSGSNVAVGFEKLFGETKNNSFNIALNYQQLDYTFNAISIITEGKSTFLNVSYRRYFLPNNPNRFSPYAGLGVLVGYQHLTGGSNGIYYLYPQDNFLYGASSHAGVEYKLSKCSLFLEGAYLFTGDHYLRANVGIKYHL